MERILTIGEVEEMDLTDLQEMLSIEETERINELGITMEQFLNEFKDGAVLTGEEDNKDFMSISDFIAHLEEMDNQIGDVKTFEDLQENPSVEMVVAENQNTQLADFRGLNNNPSKPEVITNITDR